MGLGCFGNGDQAKTVALRLEAGLSAHTATVIAAMLAATIYLSATSANAQSSEEFTSEEIQQQTKQIQDEIRAAQDANAQKEAIAKEMADIQSELALIDECLKGGEQGALVQMSFLACMPVTKEEVVKGMVTMVLSGALDPKDITSQLVHAVQESKKNVAALRLARSQLQQQYEQARLRSAEVRMPGRSDLPTQPQAPSAATAAPGTGQVQSEMGGCVIPAQNSCAYLTPEACAGFKGNYCGRSETNPCHPVNGINSC